MNIVLCLDKDDIVVSPIGNNFLVSPNKLFSISFTPAALDELIKDYKSLTETYAGCSPGFAESMEEAKKAMETLKEQDGKGDSPSLDEQVLTQ